MNILRAKVESIKGREDHLAKAKNARDNTKNDLDTALKA